MDADFAYLPQNPQLFRAVLDFNRFYEAPDFGLTEAGEPAARLAAELAARPRLWRGFGLERESPALWCFEPPENRLALLPFPAILRLAAYWRAVVLADRFARPLDGHRLPGPPAIGASAPRMAPPVGGTFVGSDFALSGAKASPALHGLVAGRSARGLADALARRRAGGKNPARAGSRGRKSRAMGRILAGYRKTSFDRGGSSMASVFQLMDSGLRLSLKPGQQVLKADDAVIFVEAEKLLAEIR